MKDRILCYDCGSVMVYATWNHPTLCGLPSQCQSTRYSAFQSSAKFAILVFQMFANGHISNLEIYLRDCREALQVSRSPLSGTCWALWAVDGCSGHSKKSYRLSQCGIGNRLRHSLVGHVLNKHRKKKKDSADGRAM